MDTYHVTEIHHWHDRSGEALVRSNPMVDLIDLR